MKLIKIGRSHENDCVFQNSTVSGHHAELLVDDNEQQGTLRDLNSTNGTFVNNVRVMQQRVSATDVIRLGSETTSLKAIIAQCGKTQLRPAGGNGGGAGVERYTIGRHHDCSIKFAQTDVSNHHAVLYRNAQGDVVIEDTNSTNGTFVNGERITSRTLHQGDRVTITRAYALNWERYLAPRPDAANGQPPLQPKPTGNKGLWASIAALFIVALLGVGGYFGWKHFSTWSSEKIYSEYGDAVCMTYSVYGYKIYLDGDDITEEFMAKMAGAQGVQCINVQDDNLVGTPLAAEGTAFFVSRDGKLATNLHITRPWITDVSGDDQVGKMLFQQVQAILMNTGNDALCSRVEVKPQLFKVGIIPNGVVYSESNLVPCTVYKEQSGMPKDVAIIQTESRSLPAKVTHIIDFNNADLSAGALKEGKKIFTIGFPSGSTMAITDNKEIHNQVHEGNVTQNRGDVSFGHDVVSEHGASGSPILNDKGQLVGINNAGFDKQGLNMGVKAKYIVDLLK